MPANRKLQKSLEDHPLSGDLADAALRAWKTIFSSTIGSLAVGKDWFPSPQLIGMFLHELVPVEVERMHPGEWRRDRTSSEKDVVCVNNEALSVEIKTSSSTKGIYGNRSVGQKLAGTRPPKKNKSGFVLAINFDKPREDREAKIRLVRLGYIEERDWIAQKAATGQQARLSPTVLRLKFITLYPRRSEPAEPSGAPPKASNQ